MAFLRNLFQSIFGRSNSTTDEPTVPTPAPDDLSPVSAASDSEADPGSGGGADDETLSHALVLPDTDFRSWYEATRSYTSHFDKVIIVRSPAGNNLNRYKTITAVRTGRVWFQADPLGHIRRAYPNVVTVDVINATSPAALKSQLDARVRTNTRLGGEIYTRFTLDWPTDSYTCRIVREFDVTMGGGKRHEGIDIAADPGTSVRSACDGKVFNVITSENVLGYGQYVQVQAEAQDGTDYLITYTQLRDIRVRTGQTVSRGDLLGVCDSTWGIKLVVQQAGKNTGDVYTMPGAIDPAPMLYVDGLYLDTTATSGLNIRKGRGTDYEKVGFMEPAHTATSLEMHGITIRKTQSPPERNQWLNIDTSAGVTGFAAGWFLQAKTPRSVNVTNLALNGVNLDIMHPLGKPNPSRLNTMTYARLPYNVSMGRGNQDLNAAYNIYAPYIDALLQSNRRVILVYTHQTYGEGAGFVWDQMNTSRWRELTNRYAEFLRVIARQFRGRIAAHQIWNEQDAYIGAQASVTMPAADYAHLLTAAIQAIRSEDPATPIITGGHTGGPSKGVRYARQTLAAMPGSIRPDGIAAHPYGRGTGSVPKFEQFGHIDETVREYGQVMPGKRIWLTEWGVLNANNEPATEVAAYANAFLNYIRRKYGDQVAATIWYAWAEGMHNGYGLVNRSDQPREPLYNTYTRIK